MHLSLGHHGREVAVRTWALTGVSYCMSGIVGCFDWPILRVFLGTVVFPARYFVSLSRLLCRTGAFMLVPIILLVGVAQVSFGIVTCRACRVKRFWKCISVGPRVKAHSAIWLGSIWRHVSCSLSSFPLVRTRKTRLSGAHLRNAARVCSFLGGASPSGPRRAPSRSLGSWI